jgi:ferrous iron transport protein A
VSPARKRRNNLFSENRIIPITSLPEGKNAIIKEIKGGRGVARRLEAMGIREGKSIKKISSMFMRGPVTVRIGHTQISIGHGIAAKIIVETKT